MAASVSARRQIFRDSRQRLGEVLPEMRRPWFAARLLGGVALATGMSLFIGVRVARALPGGALLVEGGFVLWMGLCMYGGFWRHRGVYRARYGKQAYRHLFFRFLVPFLIGAGAALYFPVLVDGRRFLPPVVAGSVAAYLLVSVLLIERQAAPLFWDFEWRAFVYNVFPERGRVVTAGIFQWLRHPIYSAATRFSLALALIRNNWTAVSCVILFDAALWCWSGVEERDLETRDAEYARYRARVPAFFVRHPVRFWRFLWTGNE